MSSEQGKSTSISVNESSSESHSTTSAQQQQQPSVVVKPKDIISLEVLAVIRECQNQHGLKHGDYLRYRQYCSKRLRRIRRTLGFVQSSGGAKQKFVYAAKPVTAKLLFEVKRPPKNTLRMLYIPLMSAERCWSYAMQLKQELSSGGSGGGSGGTELISRKKFHMLRKFRKALYWSDQFRALCNAPVSKCDARTKLEARAYADYIKGSYYFESEQWKRASELLQSAQGIYENILPLITDEEVLQSYKQRLDEIKPTLRYCAFNIAEEQDAATAAAAEGGAKKNKKKKDAAKDAAGGGTVISAEISDLFSQTRAHTIGDTDHLAGEMEWLGKKLFINHEKIRTFVSQLKDPATNWQELQLYEQLIFDCRDCLQLLRDTNAERSSAYHYLTFIRLDLIIKRNLRLITTLTNQSDILRQYEIIIGCYNEIRAIPLSPPLFTDDYAVEQFFATIDAQITMYKAYRCYYIAHVAKQNWKESIALLDRSSRYVKEALKCELITDKSQKEDLQKLLSKADADKFAIYAQCISKDAAEPETATIADTKVPLIQQLDKFCFDPEILTGTIPLINTTPEYRAIPQKPLFYDLALNNVHFPSLDEEINANKPTAGITGMVKGWLGGWGKKK